MNKLVFICNSGQEGLGHFIRCFNIASALQKLFKGKEIEASAIEAFTAKKKLEQQRQELKTFINFHYGANSWNEILHMEGQIRKQRQKEIYERQELIRKIWEWIGIIVLCITVI